MGAQQIKSYDKQANDHIVFRPGQVITVADFAKIKVDIPEILRKNIKMEGQNNSNSPEEVKDNSVVVDQECCSELYSISLPSVELKKELLTAAVEGIDDAVTQSNPVRPEVAKDNSVLVDQERCSELYSISLPSIELKEELLTSVAQGIDETVTQSNPVRSEKATDYSVRVGRERCSELYSISLPSIELKEELLLPVIQNDSILSSSCEADAESNEVQFPYQFETNEGSNSIKHLQNYDLADKENDKIKNLLQEPRNDNIPGLTNFKPNSTKLVKNPLAFLKKNSYKDREQVRCLNTAMKQEPTFICEELENTSTVKVETELETINLKDLIIKSEDLFISDTNEETLKDVNLYQTCLDTSLDVNISHEDTGLNNLTSKQTPEDVISNISLSTTLESLKYFSIYEVSSEEDTVIPVQKSQPKKNTISPQKPKAYKQRQYKLRKKRNIQNKQVKNLQQGKCLGRPKTKKLTLRKISKNDQSFKPSLKKADISKILPRVAAKTRKSIKKPSVKKTTFSSKAEFPKPFKLEIETSQKGQSELIQLPQPMMFKREFAPNSKSKQSYLKPRYQPFVRLKRLKSEELLIPLTTKHGRRTRKVKDTNELTRDFVIHQAYSLNPSIKCNRLSMDHYQSYYNEQHLSNTYATSYSALTDKQSESLGEVESKYYSPQERSKFFQFSTPGTSTFCGLTDSGMSTSTPSTYHHNANKTILLKIAAERAFINNHLMHFGHSPIQFDLFNNLDELSIFLKFLLGNIKPN